MPRHIKTGGEFAALGGGVTNTGDAVAADVASGKTFSSAALTNVAGSSTKNATVPGDAPILPAQAFVDVAIGKFAAPQSFSTLNFNNRGITSIGVGFLSAIVAEAGLPELHASGNSITNTNELLAWYAARVMSDGPAADQEIDLSGGTNAAPTGQGLIDKATLISNGWTVTTN